LVFLSDNVLHVVRTDPMVAILHQITCLMFCLGLAGIAVGFGAWFPNPREDSPSRLAAGFGGTMTLVVSTLFILILVLMTALPTHLCLMTARGNVDVAHASLAWWGGVAGTIVLGAAATLLPMWIGFRAFRRLEF
jgi:ABC-2 type transport system permease protein